MTRPSVARSGWFATTCLMRPPKDEKARNVIPVEESMLEERFGQAYHEYRARVRRWI
jgi:protein-S-isoprenylcysteine O-methyltransferase Ste14